jgi:thiol-disulfide isomerase/thioredoxin
MAAVAALTITACFVSSVQAGKFNKTVSIGDQGPAFSGVGVDDKQHDLTAYKDAKALAVVFTCNHCPVAQAYEERLIELAKDYRAKGLQVVAINVNNNDADKLDMMKDRASTKSFNFPYVYDSSQKSAVNYGASVTPHVFLLDGQRKIVYMGAIDDNMNGSLTKRHYLRDAVEAALAGKTPPVQETRQIGCGIEYERR